MSTVPAIAIQGIAEWLAGMITMAQSRVASQPTYMATAAQVGDRPPVRLQTRVGAIVELAGDRHAPDDRHGRQRDHQADGQRPNQRPQEIRLPPALPCTLPHALPNQVHRRATLRRTSIGRFPTPETAASSNAGGDNIRAKRGRPRCGGDTTETRTDHHPPRWASCDGETPRKRRRGGFAPRHNLRIPEVSRKAWKGLCEAVSRRGRER